MSLIRFFLVVMLGLWAGEAWAQTTAHCKRVKVQREPFRLDSLTVLPTLHLPDSPDARLAYDVQTGLARFEGDLPAVDSLTVCYERLAYDLRQWTRRRDTLLIDTSANYWNEVMRRTEKTSLPREQLLDLKDFQKSGNFVRGLSLGNTQNVFVNSALNLQLQGKISDDVSLTAAISDQQIPYQPEGNTLQLQDLDRVFMRLDHKNASVTAGNIVLQHRPNHFLRFYKNIQGGLLETRYALGKDSAQTYLGVAVARGKFYSATLTPSEGVQGPYRLMGANGQSFIIVLANSERVFVDGKLLQRGYDYDYTIDYNLGEITFNNHLFITRFTRIRVDFEYSEALYTRTILTAGHEHKARKWRLLSQFYREGDNPNSAAGISDASKALLRTQTAGLGLISGIDSVGFRTGEVLYQLQDSTKGGITYKNILVHRTNPATALYRAVFTLVGKEKGDYIRVNSTLNGQIFKWVEPINGVSQGEYAPLKGVSLPNRKQLWTNTLEYTPNAHEIWTAEVAFSEQKQNLFSDLPEASTKGTATRLAYKHAGKLRGDSTGYSWFGGASYEFNEDKFSAIDRFRSIEFDRDWGKHIDSSRLTEHIAQGEMGLRNKKGDFLAYQAGFRQRENQVNGTQHALQARQNLGDWQLQGNLFLLNTRQDSLQVSWERWQASLQYKNRFLVPSYRWEVDKNRVWLPRNDSTTSTAMYYEGHTFMLQNPDSAQVQYSLSYNTRQDSAPFEGKLEAYLRSETAQMQLQRNTTRGNLALTAVYRRAKVGEKFANAAQEEENLQGRLDWNSDWRVFWFRRRGMTQAQREERRKLPNHVHFQQSLSLTTATGQELRREYYFLLVPTGQGTHAWRDDNNDGLQEISEFYLALNPDERKYAKIFRPTNEYLPAYAQNLAYRLAWRVPAFVSTPKKKRGIPLSGLISWNITRRFTENRLDARLLPFVAVQDTAVLSEQKAFRGSFFFFRNYLPYSGELTYQQSAQKQLLTNGFEARDRQEIRASWRNQLSTLWTWQAQTAYLNTQTRSDFMTNRNFRVEVYQISPELAYQPHQSQRITLGYQYAYKFGMPVADSTRRAEVHQVSIEGRYSKASRNISLQARFLEITYRGDANTPLAYELLEALRVGSNLTWQASWQERLQNGLQLTFTYEGRKSKDTPLIHLGRAQIGLLF